MSEYIILIDPGHNRVYFKESLRLSTSELAICAMRLSCRIVESGNRSIAGVEYLFFKTDVPLSDSDLLQVSRLSFLFALFEVQEGLLKPVQKKLYTHMNPKMYSLLKYPGKTNEQFTRLMINVAFYVSGFHDLNPLENQLNLFDPVAGRGTTLYQAAVYGFNSSGIEIDKKSFSDTCQFIERYFKTEKVKHQVKKGKSTAVDKKSPAGICEYEYGLTRDELQSKIKKKRIRLVNADTKHCPLFFRKDHFHFMVGDLPYGIAHANISSKGKNKKSRNSLELLTDSAVGWLKILKKGGAFVMSWNKNVLSRDDFEKILCHSGFTVLKEEIYKSFEHPVDNSIKRDIIVALKQ